MSVEMGAITFNVGHFGFGFISKAVQILYGRSLPLFNGS